MSSLAQQIVSSFLKTADLNEIEDWWKPGLVAGGAMGGALAHQRTKDIREALKALEDAKRTEVHNVHFRDPLHRNRHVSVNKVPTHVARQMYDSALWRNMTKHVVGGAGIGALGGMIAQKALDYRAQNNKNPETEYVFQPTYPGGY
jgi:hypothetical protein